MKTIKIKRSLLEQLEKDHPELVKLARKWWNIEVVEDAAQPPVEPPAPPASASVHATTFLRNGAKVTSHVLMSPKLSDDDRRELIEFNKASGYGVFYLYFANEGDYGRRSVAYDPGQKAAWRKWLGAIRASGARVIVWMCADDSGGLAKLTLAQWEARVKQFHADCGDLVNEWVTGLECDERWSASFTTQLTAMLKRVTGRPVGVHTTGMSSIHYASGADLFYLQTGFGKSPSQVAALVKEARSKFSGKVIAAEYHKSGETAEAKAIGDAAIAAGAVGVGNGCTAKGLAALGGQVSNGGNTGGGEVPTSGILKAAKWTSFPKVQVDAPEIENWPTKTVDGAVCCAQLFLDGKKVEWIKRGNAGRSSVWNALNKKDGRYYRPGFAAQQTCEISVADVNGKHESNRIVLEKPVS